MRKVWLPCWEQQVVEIQEAQISLFLMLAVQRSAEDSWSAAQGLFLNRSRCPGRSAHRDWQTVAEKGSGGRTIQTVCLQIMGIIYFLYSLFKFSLNLSPFSQV